MSAISGSARGNSYVVGDIDSMGIQSLINSGADITTVMLALEIQDANKQVGEVLQKLTNIRKSREIMAEDLKFYRSVEAMVQNEGNRSGEDSRIGHGEYAELVPRIIAENPDYVQRHYPELAAKYANAVSHDGGKTLTLANGRTMTCTEVVRDTQSSLLAKKSYKLDGDYNLKVESGGGAMSGDSTYITDQEIGKYADSIEAAIRSLDAQRELEQMRLQDLVQKKQRLMTLASNIADAEHKAQKAVIDNTRA